MLQPGEMVRIDCLAAMGLVVSVQQANSVPDAQVRGLQGLQPWSCWVLVSDHLRSGEVMGPYGACDLTRLDRL